MSDHPITPPPELVEQWVDMLASRSDEEVFSLAARWGADQELEACVKLLELSDKNARDFLYSARRPKPPSLKEQALALIDDCTDPEGDYLDDNALSTIRLALETLPDD